MNNNNIIIINNNHHHKIMHYYSQMKKSSLKLSERNIRLFIRWTLEGTPRPSYMTSLLFSQSVQIPRSTFSGVFMYKFDNKDDLISEHHVKYIVPAPSRRAVLYHGFGGLGGLIWRIRSGMRQQKNEWGIGLGIFATKLKKIENTMMMMMMMMLITNYTCKMYEIKMKK